MGREIERKFLVQDDRWRAAASPGVPYRQGYVSTDPDRTVRVRLAGRKAFITLKGPSEGAGRDEYEYPIPVADAEQMLDRLAVPPLIEKTRYIVNHGGRRWEIDEFAGANLGLVLAEIELETEDQSFDRPDWAGEEVTGDPRYYNLNLSRHPHSEWS